MIIPGRKLTVHGPRQPQADPWRESRGTLRLERHRFNLNLLLERATRIDQKEVEALEETWTTLQAAVDALGQVIWHRAAGAPERQAAASTVLAFHDVLERQGLYLPSELDQRVRAVAGALAEAGRDVAQGRLEGKHQLDEQGIARYRESVVPTCRALEQELRGHLREQLEPRSAGRHYPLHQNDSWTLC